MISNFFEKLRGMPEEQKKFVFYGIIVLAALVMGAFSLVSLKNSIADLNATIAKIGQASLADSLLTQAQPEEKTQDAPWQSYANSQHNFSLSYPDGWAVSKESGDGSEVWIEKQIGNTVASLHLDVVSHTKGITTAEKGIDISIASMKEIVRPRGAVEIGSGYAGYEAVGTVCVKSCVSSNPEYAPFLVIYAQAAGKVLKFKYAEGAIGQGWDTDWEAWDYYNELQKILKTFSVLNTQQ